MDGTIPVRLAVLIFITLYPMIAVSHYYLGKAVARAEAFDQVMRDRNADKGRG